MVPRWGHKECRIYIFFGGSFFGSLLSFIILFVTTNTASLKMHHIMRPGVSRWVGSPGDQTRCVTRSGPGANERDGR